MPEPLPDLLRCPSCGAGNPADAAWCGQCHRRFGSAEGEEEQRLRSPRPAVAKRGDDLVWTCPACDAENPIAATACGRCGSTFAHFFRAAGDAPGPRGSGRTAIALSAALPGLGHWLFRQAGPAAARALLYVWSAGIAILLLARPPVAGRALVRGVGAIFALSAAAVWLLSMLETLRLTEGDTRPLVPPKALTWFSAALSGALFFGLLGAALAGRS